MKRGSHIESPDQPALFDVPQEDPAPNLSGEYVNVAGGEPEEHRSAAWEDLGSHEAPHPMSHEQTAQLGHMGIDSVREEQRQELYAFYEDQGIRSIQPPAAPAQRQRVVEAFQALEESRVSRMSDAERRQYNLAKLAADQKAGR